MKKLLSVLCLLSLFFVFTGCPYESDVSIDSPVVNINPKILGTWEARSNQDESYKITKKDDHTYSIEKKDKKAKDKESQKYFAFPSVVGGVTFLNLWENNAEASSPKYFLYKLEMTGDAMVTLSEVSENIDERFTSSDALKQFISANMKNSYFFSKEETTYIRTAN
ncbi:MAG: hypothetical protein NT126_06845 [Bacteroidetes bacterium]|nr:hypothetical protein [Bacteroidota bacterium]